jgi:hypothetical protein
MTLTRPKCCMRTVSGVKRKVVFEVLRKYDFVCV